MEYEYTPLHYSEPTQVRYLDEKKNIRYGICFHDWLVDYETGHFDKIDDIIFSGKANGVHFDDCIIEMEWLPLANNTAGSFNGSDRAL